MKLLSKLNLYIFLLMAAFYIQNANGTINYSANSFSISENIKTTFKITVRNSLGEPQKNVFLKILGRSEEYRPDTCGVISFEYEIPDTYKRNANIYLNNEPKEPVETFTLDESNTNATFKIDTREELLSFKQNNATFSIEGIVTNEQNEPIEGAIVSIQGTGRRTLTDEIGLFKIDADYNHNIIIRADGMENLNMNISRFLINPNEAFTIKMQAKNGNKIYSSVEKMPEFPGGMKNFKKYIDRNLKYPEKAKKAQIEGVVVMQFVVEKNGEITNTKVMRRLNPELDTIAYKLIEEMPRWTPASDYGITVRCKYSVPIAFKIPIPKPKLPAKDSLKIKPDSLKLINDSIRTDSLRKEGILNDSINTDSLSNRINKDSIQYDKVITDSIIDNKSRAGIDSTASKGIVLKDSLNTKDESIQSDSIKVDSKDNITETKQKVKKRNIFVRFFRWLFGIKDKDETKEETPNKNNDENTIIENNTKGDDNEKNIIEKDTEDKNKDITESNEK